MVEQKNRELTSPNKHIKNTFVCGKILSED